jgi:hypothetical protein
MARLTIRLEVDASTRKRTVVIAYQSDADALPAEHEEEHRALVAKLIQQGVISEAEGATVRVEREGGAVVGDGATVPGDVARRAIEAKQ